MLVTFSFLFETILFYCPYFTWLIKTRWGGGGVIIFLVKREPRMSKKICVMCACGGADMKKIAPLNIYSASPPPSPHRSVHNECSQKTKILGHFMVIVSLKPH